MLENKHRSGVERLTCGLVQFEKPKEGKDNNMLRNSRKSDSDNKYSLSIPVNSENSTQTEQNVQNVQNVQFILEATACTILFASFFIVLCALT